MLLLRELIAPLALASFSGDNIQAYRIGSETYLIPASEIRVVRGNPPTFLRLSPDQGSFDLVFENHRPNPEPGASQIFSISGAPPGSLSHFETSEGRVVCRSASAPIGSCAASLVVGDVSWTVLIPPGRVNEAGQILRAAREKLESYRTHGR
jgi:hypothetical protein